MGSRQLSDLFLILAVQKIEREFGVDKHSPLHAAILTACKRKRICVNDSCKKRLKFVDYLEMNVAAEDIEFKSRFQDFLERMTRVWNDSRVELYCCSCFESTTGINEIDNGLAKQRTTGNQASRSRIFW